MAIAAVGMVVSEHVYFTKVSVFAARFSLLLDAVYLSKKQIMGAGGNGRGSVLVIKGTDCHTSQCPSSGWYLSNKMLLNARSEHETGGNI